MRKTLLFIALLAATGSLALGQMNSHVFAPVDSLDPAQKSPLFQVGQTPRGDPVSLRITVCNPQAFTVSSPTDYTGESATILVDVVDADGNIVNDITLWAQYEVTFEFAEGGSTPGTSFFLGEYGLPSFPVIMDSPDGIQKQLMDLEAEQVTITASASGLASSSPVAVTFREPGILKGNLILPSGSAVQSFELTAKCREDAGFVKYAQAVVTSGATSIPFEFKNLKTGTYEVTVAVIYGAGAGAHVQGLCDVAPLVASVTEGQATTLDDTTLQVLTPGGIVGTVSLAGRENLDGTIVNIYATPLDSNLCISMQELTKTLTNNRSVPSQNDGNQYALAYLPPGEYVLNASARAPVGGQTWILEPAIYVTVPSTGSVAKDLALVAGSGESTGGYYQTILFSSPTNWEALDSATPSLEWQNDFSLDPVAEAKNFDPAKISYTVGVTDRCGNTLWQVSGIPHPGTHPNYSVVYGQASSGTVIVSPADLSAGPCHNQLLTWSVIGTIASGLPPTPTPSLTPTPTSTPSPTSSPSPTKSPTPVPSPSRSPTPTRTPGPTLTPTPRPTLYVPRVADGILGRGEPMSEDELLSVDLNYDGAIDAADLILMRINPPIK